MSAGTPEGPGAGLSLITRMSTGQPGVALANRLVPIGPVNARLVRPGRVTRTPGQMTSAAPSGQSRLASRSRVKSPDAGPSTPTPNRRPLER